jgi:hypothetical protein
MVTHVLKRGIEIRTPYFWRYAPQNTFSFREGCLIPFGFKLDTFEFLKLPIGKAFKIQNRSTERLRPELVEGSRRSPKSKIQNGITHN